MSKLTKGYLQIYTGDGKGKTTAAMGLALRAAGAGLKIYIAQFVKGMKYSEIEALRKFPDQITLRQYGSGCFIHEKPGANDIKMAREGLDEVREIIRSGKHDVVILDEASIALHYNLFSTEELIDVIKSRPHNVEIVVTGRKAPQELMDIADLVTEMKEIKHYYSKGIEARFGIEK